MGLFNRRRSSSKSNGNEPSLSVQTSSNRPRAHSSARLQDESHSKSPKNNNIFNSTYRPSAPAPIPNLPNDVFSSGSVHRSRTASNLQIHPPTPPLSPNPPSRTAHWFSSTSGPVTEMESNVEVEVEMLGAAQEQEQSGVGRTSISQERRSSISSLSSIASINGINISRIFKGNNSSNSEIQAKFNSSSSSPFHQQESIPSSPPLSYYKPSSSELQHKRSSSNAPLQVSGTKSNQISPSITQPIVFSSAVQPSPQSQCSVKQTSSRISRVRTKSTHRPDTSDGIQSGSRRLSPAFPSSPSRGRRSVDSGRPGIIIEAANPLVPTPLKLVADRLLELNLNWESRLSLVIEWVSQPKSLLRSAGKEKSGMSMRISTWNNKKTNSKYTSIREEMELLEIYLTEVVLRQIAQGRSNQEVESMRLGSVFREARQMTGLEGSSKFRLFPAVKDDTSIFSIGPSPLSSSSPTSKKPIPTTKQTSRPIPAARTPTTLGPTMVLDDDVYSSSASSSQAQPFRVVSLTPAPRRKRRPTTAPEGERKNFIDLPPSPQLKQIIKTSYQSDRINSSTKYLPGVSSFGNPRFSNESFGNTSDSPSQSASSNCDSSNGHSNLRQLSLAGGDVSTKFVEVHANHPGLDGPFSFEELHHFGDRFY